MNDIEKAIRILEGNYKSFVLRHNGELLTVNELIVLLKAQEPVEPVKLQSKKYIGRTGIAYDGSCGNCNGYLMRAWKSCPLCGKAVKW